MSLYKLIFGRFFAVWALLTFVITMIITVFFTYILKIFTKNKFDYNFYMLSKYWIKTWLFLVACPLKIKGSNNFKENENYIIVCNHNSLMDVPVASPFIIGTNKTIAKISFAKIPIFGVIYKSGSVLVNRNDEKSRRKSYDYMKRVLSKNIHMVIYPEGTRNRTNEPLKSFYDGAFKLSVDTQKEILPAVIFNTKKILPVKPSFCFLPHKIEMHFLEPFKAGNDSKVLKAKVHELMSEYYLNNA